VPITNLQAVVNVDMGYHFRHTEFLLGGSSCRGGWREDKEEEEVYDFDEYEGGGRGSAAGGSGGVVGFLNKVLTPPLPLPRAAVEGGGGGGLMSSEQMYKFNYDCQANVGVNLVLRLNIYLLLEPLFRVAYAYSANHFINNELCMILGIYTFNVRGEDVTLAPDDDDEDGSEGGTAAGAPNIRSTVGDWNSPVRGQGNYHVAATTTTAAFTPVAGHHAAPATVTPDDYSPASLSSPPPSSLSSAGRHFSSSSLLSPHLHPPSLSTSTSPQIVVYDIAFGPIGDPKSHPRILVFNPNPDSIRSCTPGSVKRHRRKVRQQQATGSGQQQQQPVQHRVSLSDFVVFTEEREREMFFADASLL
jgi:hypothetical protein